MVKRINESLFLLKFTMILKQTLLKIKDSYLRILILIKTDKKCQLF